MMRLGRRSVCLAGLAALRPALGAEGDAAWRDGLRGRFAAIEARTGGRLGVAVLDGATGRIADHRGAERFALCSTYKALCAGAVLARVDRGEDRLDRTVRFAAADVLPYSPATAPHAGAEGMTLAAVCEGAVGLSDNTAGNLMLGAVGGPAGLTAFLRGLGDATTRLDRTEPALNEALPGDERDTTSPVAMAQDLQRLVLGDALSPGSRTQLAAWLAGSRTGAGRLRAGVPAGWRAGDKTGTGDRGTACDVAVFWPPDRPPLVVTAFLTEATVPLAEQNAALAAVAGVVAAG